ncbi:MAG: hypothetical protein IT208_01125 [Chthonomonadales bacterium]|nr:hypothetical protein [Chthonomonadales bacterium]
MDWVGITKTALSAFQKGVNDWIVAARVQGGWVRGPDAALTPGSLKGIPDFEPRVVSAMVMGRIPPAVAQALAHELCGAWTAWADGLTMTLPGAYPRLAAVPGPRAPPTTAARPFPLSGGSSPGELRLQKATLSMRLSAALKPLAGDNPKGAEQTVRALADWVDVSFREWKASAQLVGVMGKGPVPTFAPPYVPVGPVVMGDNTSGSGAAIAGPRFGRPVL